MIIKTYNQSGNKIDKWLQSQSFFEVNPEAVIIRHHQENAHTTILVSEDEHFAFIISQNTAIIKKLGMIQEDLKIKPVKTMDLFNENPFDGIQLIKFLKDMEENAVNLHFDFDGRAYSFQILRDEKIAPALHAIDKLMIKKLKP